MQCLDIIDEEFKDEDIKEALRVFLSVRIRIGRMSAQSFRGIILELYQLSKAKNEALDIIRQATDRGYMKFYPVHKYRKNTYKDNIVQPVKEKTEEEKKWEEYQKYLDTVDLFVGSVVALALTQSGTGVASAAASSNVGVVDYRQFTSLKIYTDVDAEMQKAFEQARQDFNEKSANMSDEEKQRRPLNGRGAG